MAIWVLGKDYLSLENEIRELREEFDEDLSELYSPHQASLSVCISGSKKSDQTGDRIAAIIALGDIITLKIRNLKDMRMKIEHIIDRLPADGRRIMRMRYIRGFKWQQIANRLYCDESTIRRKHREIVKELNKC